jgi:hypothetical protein
MGDTIPKDVAAAAIQTEVKSHLGVGVTVEGGESGLQMTMLGFTSWEGKGTAHLANGQKKAFDCVVDFDPQAGDNSPHRLVRFTSQ